ncbi:DnaD domain protein [Staphylococcus haemolyticus]|uniref:DnaD domain protein n=1 Tax=Staphylococcus haemolyticus TaxID=1283 RepID=UPI001F0A0D00|nr:DnaD domain protein [Staphylococcus haemolyticus]MCH4334943.1 replication initiator protein A [Staphylococcus haemolyticus]
MSEQFYSIQENYRERFYAIPKVFFTSEKYKTLSNDTKMAYAILKDRLNLSIKNNWVDDNGNVYFVYSNDKLMEILNCKKEKLSKIKKALQEKGLLVQKRRGFNKTNILYLLKPIVTDNDIYLLDKEENEVETYCDKEVRKSNTEKFENRTPRSSKIEHREVRKSNTNDTDFNNTDFNNTYYNDTTTTTYNKKQSSSGNHNKLINKVKAELGINITPAYKDELLKLFSNFDDDIINHAIEYASINGSSPKQFLLKVLSNWQDANITTLEQAKNFKISKKNKNIVHLSREKTPKWLQDRNSNNSQETSQEMTEEERAEFEEDRKAFRKALEEDWGE